MKIIGSRAAAELARKGLGEKAMVCRRGKWFQVRVSACAMGGVELSYLKGKGRSWSEALRNAGVEIPAEPLGTPSMEQPEAENHKEEE